MLLINKQAERRALIKIIVYVIGTILILASFAVGSFWYVFGSTENMNKFISGIKNKGAKNDKVYRYPRLEMDGLIKAKLLQQAGAENN